MSNRNQLYPIFLKASQLDILLIGAGNVGLEKLTFLLKSSEGANVTIVAQEFSKEVIQLATQFNLKTKKKLVEMSDLENRSVIICATNDHDLHVRIAQWCQKNKTLVNVADTPELCDFYMGGIVTKGNVKIGISTNGQSPTLAKRLRQFLEEVLPEEVDELSENLNAFRKQLKGDFSEKVNKLNVLTKELIKK